MNAEIARPIPTGAMHFLEMIFPEQSNHYGTLFAGTALSLLSKAAFIAASRCARRAVVMAASERVEFLDQVKVGEMLDVEARIVRVGRSSMTVAVEAVAEHLLSGERRPALRGSFEMVAIDVHGNPAPVQSDSTRYQAEDIRS